MIEFIEEDEGSHQGNSDVVGERTGDVDDDKIKFSESPSKEPFFLRHAPFFHLKGLSGEFCTD